MSCKAVCELLIAYLDGEVTPQEKAYIELHLPDCPQCRVEMEVLTVAQTSLRNAFKSMTDEVSPSARAWDKIKLRVEVKSSWLSGLRKLFMRGEVLQVATVTAAVLVITVGAVIWQYNGFGGFATQKSAPQYGQFKSTGTPPPASETMPTKGTAYNTPNLVTAPPTEPTGSATLTAPTPKATPETPSIPMPPPPPPPFQVSVVPEEASYLPEQKVEVKLSLSNSSSEIIKLAPYPPEIRVKPSEQQEIVFSTAAGTQTREIKPGDMVDLGFTWDQKDKDGKQVSPGWYDVDFEDITVTQEDRRNTLSPRARLLVQFPQGAMEKNLELNQSKTANGITFTLERIEFTSAGMKVYAFNTPPGFRPPQDNLPDLPTSPNMVVFAEYTVDGGAVKQSGPAGMRFLENGTMYIWDHDRTPVPSDAKELTLRIRMSFADKPEELLGTWEFKIRLR